MLDFINIEVRNLLPKVWLDNPILQGSDFPLEVIESSGEVLRKKRIAEYQGLTFKLFPSSKQGGYTMLLSGSLHKYRNNGTHNYDRFSFTGCVKVIEELFTLFDVNPKDAILHSLEFGVNIKLPYPTQKLIQSVVVHRNTPYEAIAKNRRNGVVCVRDGYEVKIYDKGFVCGLDSSVVRLEYHVSKMRELEEYGIKTLADLTDKTKISPLLDLLMGALEDTVFIPPDADLSSLTKKQKINFHAMGKPYVWQQFGKQQRYKAKLSLAKILEKCNAFDHQSDLKNRLVSEWKTLLVEPEKTECLTPIIEEKKHFEKNKKVTFTPLEYRMETSPKDFLENKENKREKSRKNRLLETGKRYCKTCGKEIIGSRANSLFCRKSTNPNAKKCRNKDSNIRRTLKAQIMRAKVNNQFLRITYKDLTNQEKPTFTDILHSSEIAVHRGLLNIIVSVEVLPNESEPALYQDLNHAHHGELFTGKDAVEVLEELTAENSRIEELNKSL